MVGEDWISFAIKPNPGALDTSKWSSPYPTTKESISMDVKLLHVGAILEIDGVKFHHYSNGGGLVVETATVGKTAYVGPFAVVLALALGGNDDVCYSQHEAKLC